MVLTGNNLWFEDRTRTLPSLKYSRSMMGLELSVSKWFNPSIQLYIRPHAQISSWNRKIDETHSLSFLKDISDTDMSEVSTKNCQITSCGTNNNETSLPHPDFKPTVRVCFFYFQILTSNSLAEIFISHFWWSMTYHFGWCQQTVQFRASPGLFFPSTYTLFQGISEWHTLSCATSLRGVTMAIFIMIL